MSPSNDFSSGSSTSNGENNTNNAEVVIVGAGFGGIYLLNHLRNHGYNVRIFEAGADLGGVWWWNSYPGARVDTSFPMYEFAAQELWEDWTWKEKFPGRDELMEYFGHVDKKWDVRRHIQFNTMVDKCVFDIVDEEWTVYTSRGNIVKTKFVLLATGFAAKHYTPPIKGLDNFQGISCHTAHWPKEGIDIAGKRVGVIGTGASGVQVIQEIGQKVKHLTVFQRTANTALPMRQKRAGSLEVANQNQRKSEYPALFDLTRKTFAGWDYDQLSKLSTDDSPEAREALWEDLWVQGGFHPWLGNYQDLLTNQDLNNSFYNFWRNKVRARITKHDPELLENLAPELPENPFGTKRPSLEQQYYEIYNQSNVDLVNIRKNPIIEVSATGVKTLNGEIPLDILILATGFDAVTGSILQIDIEGIDGKKLADKWKEGSSTYLGIATAGFPNLLFMYGPQSPTAFAIGPRISEIQGDWIISCLNSMRAHKQTRIDALTSAENAWSAETNAITNATLIAKSDSWYMGANIPGKPREALNYMGGMPKYTDIIERCAKDGYNGFVLT
ncbi:hypothetical protein RBB50_011386 [Rhinocladiella similis]